MALVFHPPVPALPDVHKEAPHRRVTTADSLRAHHLGSIPVHRLRIQHFSQKLSVLPPNIHEETGRFILEGQGQLDCWLSLESVRVLG